MFKPVYSITPVLVNAISRIAEIKAIVERSKVLPLNEAQLRRQAIVRMTHTSTSIEGNKLAEFQVDKVLAGQTINADQKSIQEVKNYQHALTEIDDLAQKSGPLTIDQILHIHKILMKGLLPEEKTGHFRPGDIYIVDDLGDGREKVRFHGPDSQKVPFLVNELLKWLVESEHENLHPILKAAIFHLHFVTIHPFSDGNGRITRLLTTYLLGWDFRKILVLEDFYNRDRQGYYNALNLVQGDHFHLGEDLTSWIEYFITGFLVEAQKVAESIQSIGFGKASEQSEQIFLDKDEIHLLDFLTTTGKMTSADVMELTGVAKRTAQWRLKNLVEKGLIEAKGKGPATFYELKR
jgi:Fic family protein